MYMTTCSCSDATNIIRVHTNESWCFHVRYTTFSVQFVLGESFFLVRRRTRTCRSACLRCPPWWPVVWRWIAAKRRGLYPSELRHTITGRQSWVLTLFRERRTISGSTSFMWVFDWVSDRNCCVSVAFENLRFRVGNEIERPRCNKCFVVVILI